MFEFAHLQDALPLVLLIDDDLVSREVTATVLTMNGYSVHTAESGVAALALLTAAEDRPRRSIRTAPARCHPDGCADARFERNRVDCRAPRAQLRRASMPSAAANPPPEIAAAADGFLLKPFTPMPSASSSKAASPGLWRPRSTLLDLSNEPVVSPEILAQLRKLMPETAVRQIYHGRRH